MRRFGFFMCSLVVVITTTLLVNGSDLLVYAVIEDPFIPLGNVLTWLAMIALPLSLYLGVRRFRMPRSKVDRILKVLLIIAIVLGVIWYPVSWALADNLSGSFGGNGVFRGSARAGEYYWFYTYTVVGFPLLLWIFHLLLRLFRK
ncbi:hypothetical protein J1N09_10300 [Aureitalea sp. L0-47]|uniref:hypothetical protein n=1 Tax=Aureitalea sp. L0-47 TaxID=2816962 RepID=UPI00223842B0|nr:hypothetical protein [Aureitalea sp. L0-47]MCW5520230.1 hypothetical protein [Aureitalea sp. L0-47]